MRLADMDAPSGLERTDNGMKPTSWPEVTPINQKNYYTYVQAEDAGGEDARRGWRTANANSLAAGST